MLRIAHSKIQLPRLDKINALFAETDTSQANLTDVERGPEFRAAPALSVAEPF
jgi:hypothetical protein